MPGSNSKSIYIAPIAEGAVLAPGDRLFVPRTINPGDHPGVIAPIVAGAVLELVEDRFGVCRTGEVLVRVGTPVGTVDTLPLPTHLLARIEPNPFTAARVRSPHDPAR